MTPKAKKKKRIRLNVSSLAKAAASIYKKK